MKTYSAKIAVQACTELRECNQYFQICTNRRGPEYPSPYFGQKNERHLKVSPIQLSYEDSNLDKQNQNLLCYHYTIRQCL